MSCTVPGARPVRTETVTWVWLFRSECPGAGAGGAGGVRPGLAGGR